MTINHTDTIKNDAHLKRPYVAPAVTFLSVGEVEAKIVLHYEAPPNYGSSS